MLNAVLVHRVVWPSPCSWGRGAKVPPKMAWLHDAEIKIWIFLFISIGAPEIVLLLECRVGWGVRTYGCGQGTRRHARSWFSVWFSCGFRRLQTKLSGLRVWCFCGPMRILRSWLEVLLLQPAAFYTGYFVIMGNSRGEVKRLLIAHSNNKVTRAHSKLYNIQ